VYFRALDDAGFSAANSLAEDVFVLTASFGIHLLRPVAPGDMKAIGKVVQASKNMFIAEATLTNSEGEEIARGIGTYARGKAPLSPDMSRVSPHVLPWSTAKPAAWSHQRIWRLRYRLLSTHLVVGIP
jgi:hypothetical protein